MRALVDLRARLLSVLRSQQLQPHQRKRSKTRCSQSFPSALCLLRPALCLTVLSLAGVAIDATILEF